MKTFDGLVRIICLSGILNFITGAWNMVWGQLLSSPTGLTCEFLRNPADAVITDSVPEFSWIFPQDGISQSAFRILVSSQLQYLKQGHADLWDSKKVNSVNSINISYGGKPLPVESSFWWQVKVWSENEDSSFYSSPQLVHVGDYHRLNLEYPGQSRWVEISDDTWVSEDRQCAQFYTVKPTFFTFNDQGNYFAEFPKAAFGTIQFIANAKSEQRITIYLGERRSGEEVDKNPGVSNIGFNQVEIMIRKGLDFYQLELPQRPASRYLHSQKLAEHYPEVVPFRYSEIQLDSSEVEIISINQQALYYYFDDDASAFSCSDFRLQSVWDLCKYTLKATPFLGVYADGNRERMPYEADAYIQQLGHYSVDREYAIGRYTLNFLLDHASWPTEWQMHTVLMAWQHYLYTGDLELLKSRYNDLKRKTLYQLAEDNGLISTRKGKKTRAFLDSLNFPGAVEQFRDIVDWPQGPPPGKPAQSNQSPVPGGETDGYVFTDFNTVVNAYHNRSLVIMSHIAKLLGFESDYIFFRERSDQHRRSFLQTFFDPERKIFKDGDGTEHASLHANMFALVFDLVPESAILSVTNFVKSRGMACSVYGAQFLLEALFQGGEDQAAINLMTDDGKRSWMNMLHVGATMTTEAWDEYFKPNLTWNHAWGASPANIIVRKLFGIVPLEPGFQTFQIQPQPGDLSHLSIKTPTIKGPVFCEIENSQGKWDLSISVPGNTMAHLILPPRFQTVEINREKLSAEDLAMSKIVLKTGVYKITCR